jgi:hypothetical protein
MRLKWCRPLTTEQLTELTVEKPNHPQVFSMTRLEKSANRYAGVQATVREYVLAALITALVAVESKRAGAPLGRLVWVS